MELIQWIIKTIVGLFKMALITFASVSVITVIALAVVLGMFL